MVTIRVRVALADILLEIATEVYKSYVRKDNKGKNILIIPCLNAIYVTMVEIMLYHRKFCKILLVAGFKLNPYDPFVANPMGNGK